jgi:hypothetical protein
VNLERQALKVELAPADQFFKIAKPLIVGDASIAAGSMVRKQIVSRSVGGRALDTVQPGSPVGQPVCRRRRYTRVAPHGFFCRKVAFMEARVEKNDVPVDGDLGLSFRCFKVGDIDLAKVGNVGQVQADGIAHEHVQRHFIDRLALLTHVEKGVDMGADMINHADESGRAAQLIARDSKIPLPKLFVSEMRYNERSWEKFVSQHIICQRDRQVDDPPLISISLLYDLPRPTSAFRSHHGRVPAAGSFIHLRD